MRFRDRCHLAALLLTIWATVPVNVAIAKTWRDETGKTYEGALIAVKNGTGCFIRPKGEYFFIPLNKLSEDDQKYVKSLQEGGQKRAIEAGTDPERAIRSASAPRPPLQYAVKPSPAVSLRRDRPVFISGGDWEPFPGYKYRQINGFHFIVEDAVLRENDKSDYRHSPLQVLAWETRMITSTLPPAATAVLRTVPIWVEWFEPSQGRTAMALYWPGNSRFEQFDFSGSPPIEMAKANCVDIVNMHSMTDSHQGDDNGSDLLHELAHAVHHHMFGNMDYAIKAAYANAMSHGLYGKDYAATNATEYFAELSQAYFTRLDYRPHDRAELKEYDPMGYRLMEMTWGTPEAIFRARRLEREREGGAKFIAARNLLQGSGSRDEALGALQGVVRDYPGTVAANEARKLLAGPTQPPAPPATPSRTTPPVASRSATPATPPRTAPPSTLLSATPPATPPRTTPPVASRSATPPATKEVRQAPPPATAHPIEKFHVLVVSGGIDYPVQAFRDLFGTYRDMDCTFVDEQDGGEGYDDITNWPYDAIVLYNYQKNPPKKRWEHFLKLLDRGVGVVVLHHAIEGYRPRPKFKQIAGVKSWPSGNKQGVDLKVHVEAPQHPITKGLQDFSVIAETYSGLEPVGKAEVLLTTDDPSSARALAWVHTYSKSRVCFLQLGHDENTYSNEQFKTVLGNAIRWSAHRLAE